MFITVFELNVVFGAEQKLWQMMQLFCWIILVGKKPMSLAIQWVGIFFPLFSFLMYIGFG